MGERNHENNQLEAVLADYQRLKEENAALRRLLVDNGITILARPKSGSPPAAGPHAQDAGIAWPGFRAAGRRMCVWSWCPPAFLGPNIKPAEGYDKTRLITLSNIIARKWFLEWLRRMIG
jgi:hypothetical protein